MNEESHNLEEKSVKLDKEKCSPEGLFGQQSSLLSKIKRKVQHTIFVLQSFCNIYLIIKDLKQFFQTI